ncbi:hypothetical protein ACZ11_04865 [Lysinibacillus xylanilyticus]|uniref:Uncharacterized protein n=1 Tax=Lysinibacillus xylanilyticus TaxID=582475 RepID=A0A0K9FAU3_9BACI|nr:hypothetical protein ACZ11_04865 [Lysinibacillus xylanilyticus]
MEALAHSSFPLFGLLGYFYLLVNEIADGIGELYMISNSDSSKVVKEMYPPTSLQERNVKSRE